MTRSMTAYKMSQRQVLRGNAKVRYLKHEALLSPVRQRKLNFTIKAARSQKSWIKSISTISGHDHLHVYSLVEPVHLQQQRQSCEVVSELCTLKSTIQSRHPRYLIQKFHQNTLHLPVRPSLCIEPSCGNSIDLIDKNDSRGIFFGEPKHITHHTRTL